MYAEKLGVKAEKSPDCKPAEVFICPEIGFCLGAKMAVEDTCLISVLYNSCLGNPLEHSPVQVEKQNSCRAN